jgi:hypothetical protein
MIDNNDTMGTLRITWDPDISKNSTIPYFYRQNHEDDNDSITVNGMFTGSPDIMRKAMEYLGICPLF